VAFPVVVAAFVLRKQIIIHESDSIPGMVSRISGRLASVVLLGFPEASHFFDEKKIQIVGQILSPRLFNSLPTKKSARRTQLLVM